MSKRVHAALAIPLLLFALLPVLGAKKKDPYKGWDVIKIQKGPNALTDLKTAFLTVTPGTIIELPAATIDVDEQLSLTVDHVVIRGKGMKKSVLNFASQASGGEGILVDGADYVTFENFSVIDTPGDGIKTQMGRGITFRRMFVGWTMGEPETHGAYAIYPVLAEDVLVEKSVVDGASDAGIYVGQSNNIIVRKNKVVNSVAGIEIENSFDADVYKNKLTKNTGGVLVFNLPGLTQLGARTRVFKNKIYDNNTSNFGSGTVGQVSPGTGIIVLANDEVEIFKNKIEDNRTVGIAIASYNLIGATSPPYDPYTETIFVYKNKFKNNGYAPNTSGSDAKDQLGFVVGSAYEGAGLGGPPTILNLVDPDPSHLVGDALPLELEVCVQEKQKKTTYGEFNLAELFADPGADPVVTKEPAKTLGPPHDCTHPKLDPVVLPEPPAPPSAAVSAACTPGSGSAFLANCPKLSDYALFEDNDPRQPAGVGLPYDLTMPLFSDYAVKYRAVFVPDGQAATYDEEDIFDLPVGTILAKTFAFAHDLRDPEASGEDLVETRLLIHRPGGWVGLPYIWNSSEREAYLSLIGGAEQVSWIHTDGSERQITYRVPNANMCSRCHFEGPIGPKARLLNRELDYADFPENQLSRWASLGILTGAPLDPGTAPQHPTWDKPWEDPELTQGTQGELEQFARAYLESNCAHCHNPLGSARNTGLYLEWDRPLADIASGLCKITIAAGEEASGGFLYDVVPGDAGSSVLTYRLASVQPNVAMPEIAKTVVHDEGVALVADWIDSLTPAGCP